MDKNESTETTKFYERQMKPIMGYTAVATVHAPQEDFEDQWYGILFQKKGCKDKVMWLLSDDEGNGIGSFEIETVEDN